MHSRHVRRDPADDLVRDGLEKLGHLLDRDRLALLAAYHRDFIPDLDTPDAADVYHRVVHADAPDYRRAPAADEHPAPVREAAVEAVGISYGKRRYDRLPLGHVRPAVTDESSRRRFLEIYYPRLER